MVPDCFSEVAAIGMERSMWFKLTVPNVNGDGSNVIYEINTSVNDNCNFVNGPVEGSADTQIVLYTAAFGCPTSLWTSNNYIACNDDIDVLPPYVAGVNVSLIPGESYYIVVDTYNGSVGEFCLDILLCGKVCDDGRCSSSENFCSCSQDCVCEILKPQYTCVLQNGQLVACGTSPVNDFIFCDSYFNNANQGSVYVGFNVGAINDCDQVKPTTTNIFYNNGLLLDENLALIPTGSTIQIGQNYFFEFTENDVNQNTEIGVIVSTELSNGKVCSNSLDINAAEILSISTVNCGSCAAGNVDLDLDNQTVSRGGNINVCTDGLENLNIFCDSNDNSNFEYRWVVYTDLNNDGTFNTAITPPLEAEVCGLLSTDFLINWFNVFDNGSSQPVPVGKYQICGVALCDDSDGTIVNICETDNCININLTDVIAIPGCTNPNACNYNEMATENDNTCLLEGATCNDDNPQTTNDIIVNCVCEGEITGTIVEGCTNACYIEYNPQANTDNGTCETIITGCTNPNAINYNVNLDVACGEDVLCVFSDGDNDTVPDYLEDVNGNGNLLDDDTDEDGLINILDPDDDGDGILTINEDANNNGDLFDDDTDGDGIPNFLDAEVDSDGDTLPDYLEDVNENGDLLDDDTDEDGLANFLDRDDDGDGIFTDQEDINNNGDLFDDDTDGDGIPNFLDVEMVSIENYETQKINVLPNPNNGIFRLEAQFIVNRQTLHIVNATGQTMNYELVAGYIKITNAQKGIYLGYIKNDNIVFKILVE